MNRKILFLFLSVVVSFSGVAQPLLTLEEIWSGTFRTKGMDELNAMKNSNEYTILNFNRNEKTHQIDLYDFATLEKVKTILHSKDFSELSTIDSYLFSKDETKILIASESNSIFRHSFTATYFVYDIQQNTLKKVSSNAIQEPTFSADGTKIAYAYENNLYVLDLLTNVTLQITTDGKKNEIINGICLCKSLRLEFIWK